MKKRLVCSCFLFIILGLVGCGSSEESIETEGSSVDAIQESSVIEEIKGKAETELSVDNIFVPEMEDLEIKNAFVSFSGEEPFSVDVQYHAEVSDKDERFENEIVVEEEKEKTGMKHIVPPYVNGGICTFGLYSVS
ncbi:hypothetical protein JCM9140_4900 [Halalkalibacter wakoensis JCM 9140]|uniref:Lipoprotein n=1 Tax=Halalkalibacter wakoensis JCM 9140 TaxID=1236970 RepID=W4Q9H1_9BACI|nr:hypothetical protein [Halalkalibacter wakoensis]GAE28645.1 hypothetical protein JCM9140_4900 [Halalkalibacter wakoensis JCM 9140]